MLRLLDESKSEVSQSDTKANMLFGVTSLVIGILVSQLVDDAGALRANGDGVQVLAIASLVLLSVALGCLGVVVTPRLGAPVAGRARYFEEHAGFADAESLLAAVRSEADLALLRHAQQLHVIGRIVRRKYRYVRYAMLSITGAMAMLAGAAIVGMAT